MGMLDNDFEDDFNSGQRLVSILLYIALLAHGLGIFLYSAGVLVKIVPTLELIAAVATLVFFIAECLILPPLGVVIMTGVSALLFWVMPYFVAFMVQSFIESIVLIVIGGLIMALSVGVVVFVVDGIIIGSIIAPLIVTPFLASFGGLGLTILAGGGAIASVDAGMRQIRTAKRMRSLRLIINFVLLLVLVWPVFTWMGVFQGVFALKPVLRAQQEYRSFSEKNSSINYESFFTYQEGGSSYSLNGEKNWTFGDGFYNNYIYPNRNTFAQGSAPAASNEQCLAFYLNGMIYQVNLETNVEYQATAFELNREDTMVMLEEEVFVFCHDRIALLGQNGRYLWKDTQWTSDFEALSIEEQYERLYDILEEQNDGTSAPISIEDVAVVAYAQRNGLLLYYDSESHSAYFGQNGANGEITILRQNESGAREKTTSFTPNCDSDNLPYTMVNADVVGYINGTEIVFQSVNGDWTNVRLTNNSHNGELHPFVSLHVMRDADGNEYCAYQDSEDKIFLDFVEHYVIETDFNSTQYKGVYAVGTDIYGILYDSDNLLGKFTYIKDKQEGDAVTAVWNEAWNWERIRLYPGLWGVEEAEEEEETISWEERPFEERYPIPELRTSVRQIGLYMDNVVSPSQYLSYRGPADNFWFRYPPILYEEVEYTYSEDDSEVQLYFYCKNDPSSLTVTLKPNAEGIDHSTLLQSLQKSAEDTMGNVKRVRSGKADEEGNASTFYLTGYDAENPNLICTKLCWVDSEHIMEMVLRLPEATSKEDQARKDFYVEAMYDSCGFGSGKEPEAWQKFKKAYGL